MKKYLTFILFIIVTQLNAQDANKKLDFKFGVGKSLLGTGDMRTINFENEINYKINNYFSSSFTLNFGYSDYGVFKTSTYFQGNLNVFISPFKNNKKNDFRIGTGLSIMNVFDSYYIPHDDGVVLNQSSAYYFDKRNSSGLNIIIEDTYSFKGKYLIGLKLYSQPYFNGDLNTGILLKIGLKL